MNFRVEESLRKARKYNTCGVVVGDDSFSIRLRIILTSAPEEKRTGTTHKKS